MSVSHHQDTPPSAALPGSPAPAPGSGFGDEFRDLARQRRFVRDGEQQARQPTPTDAGRAIAATRLLEQSRPARAALTPPPTSPTMPTAQRPERRPGERLSRDPINVMMEMSRLADRLIEAREALVATRAHAVHLERELERSRAETAAANDRVLAARALVHEAQRAAHEAAEQCAFLEGRCEALDAALDIAINASIATRWKWRRQAKRQQRVAT